jgi:hypothetical protein
MTTVVTRGAASAQALGYASSSAAVTYIEDVFSTYLYTGNASTQTITNGIDLSGKGGLVWIKNRPDAATAHALFDTVRGATKYLQSQATSAEGTQATSLTAFNSNGYSLGAASFTNNSGTNYASWTFREQPKFFDVVTYTGDSVAGREIAHNLGSVPGCIIVKKTSGADDWAVLHKDANFLQLNTTAAQFSTAITAGRFGAGGVVIRPTSTVFTLGAASEVNFTGATYVAYLFAHNAGGFGLTGTDNVISCGSFTTDGSGNATVSLGYEPQWVLIKQTDGVDSWYLNDNMRGLAVSGNQPNLSPNSTAAESAGGYNTYPNATGFTASVGIASKAYIYIAIRRGPMKVPTSGTSVYATDTLGGTLPNPPGFNSGFPVDLGFYRETTSAFDWNVNDRLRGNTRLFFNSTAAEASTTAGFDYQDGFNSSTSVLSSYRGWMFRRAPGFFDEVCYTGTGVARTVTHNLAAVPEMMIVRSRDNVTNWNVYTSGAAPDKRLFLETTSALNTSATVWNNTVPTSSVFSVGGSANVSTWTFVAYLFATVAGVSKVGSYTGTGTTQTINCGFTAGSRFVLIKRTDSTGDWYVWDSARGIVAGNDPHLSLNTTAAEVTTDDSVDTDSTGFVVNQVAATNVNVTSASYIFLAVS